MPHFFINSNQIDNKTITIEDKENYFHIARSLRARKGEKLLLIDENKIQYETLIKEITNNKITVEIVKFYPSKRYLDFELYLAQSPLHSDAQNILIEKATELGVCGIYSIHTDNCTLNSDIINKRIIKWNKIACESSKQCERAYIPKVYESTTIEKLIAENHFDKIMVFCERIAKRTIKDSFTDKPINKGDKVLVIIGPEGGFSPNEFDYFAGNNFEMLTLGDMILRAETAVTVALGNIIYEYENHKR